MYSVVGTDGQVYGPVDVDTLRAWSKQGRVAAKTNLLDPISGRVLTADSLDELRDLFLIAPPIITPLPPPIQPGYQQPYDGSVVPGYPTNSGYPVGQGQAQAQLYPPQQNAFLQQGVPGQTPIQVNIVNTQQGPLMMAPGVGTKSRTTAALLCFFLGPLGVHRYYLGHNGSGTAMLAMTFFSAGVLSPVTVIWSWVDLFTILTGGMRDSNQLALL